jgi:hypothetical protein
MTVAVPGVIDCSVCDGFFYCCQAGMSAGSGCMAALDANGWLAAYGRH